MRIIFKSKDEIRNFLQNEFKKFAESGDEHSFRVIGGSYEIVWGERINFILARGQGIETIIKCGENDYVRYWRNGNTYDQRPTYDLTEDQIVNFLWENRKMLGILENQY